MRPECFARSITHQFIQSVSSVVFYEAHIQPIYLTVCLPVLAAAERLPPSRGS
jgi:hypothetical protein